MPKAAYHDLEDAISHLKIGDIILIRGKETLAGRLIRKTTNSYWSHVAMVFDVPQYGSGGYDVLIAETNDRIEIHRLNFYLQDPDLWDMGIKRLRGLTDTERDRFRGFFLDSVDAPYDYRRIFLMFFQKLAKWALNMNLSYATARRLINTENFICTSLVQRAFYLAVNPEKRGTVFFRQSESDNFLHQLEEIEPKHIAKSSNTHWLYNPHN